MPRIHFTHPIQVPPVEARRRLDGLQAEFEEQFGLVPAWVTPTEVRVSRPGASGRLTIEPSHIGVHIDLSFALTPLRGRIEREIRRRLGEAFAD